MEKASEQDDNVECEGATASVCPEILPPHESTDKERELHSKLSVDEAKRLKSPKLPLKINPSKSPEPSDLIKPLEEMNLFELPSSGTSELLEESKFSESSVKSKTSEPSVKSKIFGPSVRSKISEPSVKSKISEPSVKSKIFEPSVRSKIFEPSVRSKISEPSVRSKISEPSVRSKISEPSVRSKISEPSVRSKISEPSVRSKIFEPSVRPKISEPSLASRISETPENLETPKASVKSKKFKSFRKHKLKTSGISESLETFKFPEQSEKLKLADTINESMKFKLPIKPELSDPSVESLTDSPKKSKLSKFFTSKIFKPFVNKKLSISEPSIFHQASISFDSNLSAPAGTINVLESPGTPKLPEFVMSEMSKSPVKPKKPPTARGEDAICTGKSKNRQMYKSNKILDENLEIRRSYMIALYRDVVKVKTFLDEVAAFKPPYRYKYVRHFETLYQKDANDWADLHSYWISFKRHINELIGVIQDVYINCKEPISLTMEEFQDFVELLVYVFIDIRELSELCENGLDKYRKFCFCYNEYLFVVYAATFSMLVASLRERLRIELSEFKLIEEKVLGLNN